MSAVKQSAVSKYKSTPFIQNLTPHSFVLLPIELEYKMLSEFKLVHDPFVNPVYSTHKTVRVRTRILSSADFPLIHSLTLYRCAVVSPLGIITHTLGLRGCLTALLSPAHFHMSISSELHPTVEPQGIVRNHSHFNAHSI